MAPRKISKSSQTQGFSLFDLQEVISNVTDTLADALDTQGVPVNKDTLFLQLQNLIQNIGTASLYNDGPVNVGNYNSSYSGLTASDGIPYSIAGDLLVISYEHYKNNDKKDAIRTMMAAMDSEDFSAIANGLFLMNKKNEVNLLANDVDTDNLGPGYNNADELADDETKDLEESDDDDSEDSEDDDNDLSDDEITDDMISDLINDHETTASDKNKDSDTDDPDEDDEDTTDEDFDDDDNDKDDSDEDNTEDSDDDTEDSDKKIEASLTSRILANKLSLDGTAEGRAKAKKFIQNNSNI